MHVQPRTPTDSDPVVIPLEPFEPFYRREFAAVVGLAYALSGSRLAAEDIAQEAFMAAHAKWEEIGRYDYPGGWVRRVVSNRSVSWLRRRSAETRAVAKVSLGMREALPELEAPDAEFWAEVRKLPTKQSQALALFYLEDRPVKEIAEVLGCTESTAKVHLHKGRKNLAKRLGVEP